MFVPIHARRVRAAGKSVQNKVRPAVLAAVLTAVMAGMASNLLHARALHGGSVKAVAFGLAIGVGAAALGLALARAIGRQPKG